jgi:hypothetical protein
MRKSMLRGMLVLAACVAATAVAGAASAPARTLVTQQVALSGSGGPTMGAFTPSADGGFPLQDEFANDDEDDATPPAYGGSIVNRSLSRGHGGKSIAAPGVQRSKSNPGFKTGFEGLNFFQQRYARGGNQFSIEPPDQALCVGNGYVFEAVNDVVNIYDKSGASVLPDNTATNIVAGFPTDVNHAVDLNSFFGYAPAINRANGVAGPELTDPTCIYDAQTQRFFVVVLTLDRNSTGGLNLVNHLDLAVSTTSDPTGTWNIYKTDVTNDGSSNPDPHNACPCIGDYPHIGADANGIYLTTNAYPWGGNGFNGAQIYAYSKAQLAAGATSVTMQHIDTFGAVNVASDAGPTQPGFTVWPAQSPGTGSFEGANNGTEYLLSSNAADEAKRPIAGTGGDYMSSQLVVWSLKNTASLNSFTAALSLTNKVLATEDYAIPPKQHQPGSGTAPGTNAPQGHCINDTATLLFNGQTGCWRLVFGAEPAHNEVVSTPDSNDTRMQQVTFANGKLWGALDTAINPDGGTQRAGVAYFVVNPAGGATPRLVNQGYLGSGGTDFTYPAIGVTPSGRGVMAFTVTGDTTFPSAGYASIDAGGIGQWTIAQGGAGAAPDDGFTSYKSQVGNPPRTRWGDYGAAAVDGNSIWIASEYIAQACDYTAWGGPFFAGGTGDNKLGTCAASPGAAGKRGALGNWSTRISQLTP